MGENKRRFKRFSVKWRARILLPDNQLCDVLMHDVSKGGVGIDFDYVLSVGTAVKIEFFISFAGNKERVRAKTQVTYATLLSDNKGAKIGLEFNGMSSENMHALANVLHTLGYDESGGKLVVGV